MKSAPMQQQARFTVEVTVSENGVYRAALVDNENPDAPPFTAIGWREAEAVIKLKNSVADSPFASAAEKEAAARIEVAE